jgi:translation initiation factor IF-2
VRDGTLTKGDVILSSRSFGRARGIYDCQGRQLDSAGPSMPVQVTGFSDIPDAGDRFYVLDNLDRARAIAEKRADKARQTARLVRRHVTLETLAEQLKAGGMAELKVILKADVKGSLEALLPQLAQVGTAEAKVNVIHAGVGSINVSDVLLADASDAVCVGFDVDVDSAAKRLAEERGVQVRLHKIIYGLLDEVKKSLEGKLAPAQKETIIGHAEVRQVFKIGRVGAIAGCYVTDGVVERTGRARVLRNGAIVFDGALAGLKRFKDDVRDVREGFECGIRFDGFDEVMVGDRVESYRIEEVARTLV